MKPERTLLDLVDHGTRVNSVGLGELFWDLPITERVEVAKDGEETKKKPEEAYGD